MSSSELNAILNQVKQLSPDDQLLLIGEIADDFTRRHQAGEDPQIQEYITRHSELAELLREILPAIQALSPARGPAAAVPKQLHADRARPNGLHPDGDPSQGDARG